MDQVPNSDESSEVALQNCRSLERLLDTIRKPCPPGDEILEILKQNVQLFVAFIELETQPITNDVPWNQQQNHKNQYENGDPYPSSEPNSSPYRKSDSLPSHGNTTEDDEKPIHAVRNSSRPPWLSSVVPSSSSNSKESISSSSSSSYSRIPVVKATAPVVNAIPPVFKTNAPVVKTNAPVVRTNAPVVRTNAPVVRSNAPVVRTNAPAFNTIAPVFNNNAPVFNTIPPLFNTNAPVFRTIAPLFNAIAINPNEHRFNLQPRFVQAPLGQDISCGAVPPPKRAKIPSPPPKKPKIPPPKQKKGTGAEKGNYHRRYRKRFGTDSAELRPFYPLNSYPHHYTAAGFEVTEDNYSAVFFAFNIWMIGDGHVASMAKNLGTGKPYEPVINTEIYRRDLLLVTLLNYLKSFKELPKRIMMSIGNFDALMGTTHNDFHRNMQRLVSLFKKFGVTELIIVPLIPHPSTQPSSFQNIQRVLSLDWGKHLGGTLTRIDDMFTDLCQTTAEFDNFGPYYPTEAYKDTLLKMRTRFIPEIIKTNQPAKEPEPEPDDEAAELQISPTDTVYRFQGGAAI